LKRELILKYALKNAQEFGEASSKAVMGKVLAENPELKSRAKSLFPTVEEVVKEVNSLPREEIEERVKGFTFQVPRKEEKKGLPELEVAEEGVAMRFAPNPSGPLHLGHARAIVLNSEYVKKYGGKLILRFEDTDPGRVMPQAYDMIREDLGWLGVRWDEEVAQSSRLEVYYEQARDLIEGGYAYVCTCRGEDFQGLKVRKEACPHRDKSPEENGRDFRRMFNEFAEGEAVLRFKSGVNLPDPAMREFPLMRISDQPHPLVDARVYPLMNFSVAVDDHLLGVTHVLRGKDHIVNTRKQEYIYRAMGWERPEFIHYGRLKIEGLALSTSSTGDAIKKGKYEGWDDVQLGTLRALRKRGFQPQAITDSMLDVGIKQSDISFSWKNLYSYNRQIIEPRANRYFFVAEPRVLEISKAQSFENYAPLHPDYEERGKRRVFLEAREGRARVLIAGADASTFKKGEFIRLMEGFNVEIEELGEKIRGEFKGFDLREARERKASFIHWLPEEGPLDVEVRGPQFRHYGYGEKALENESSGAIVQFERYGFCRLGERKTGIFYFTHP